ncbi:MAG: hypothetical protein QW165_03530 [Candidatus Woesearchaeota archaeon]
MVRPQPSQSADSLPQSAIVQPTEKPRQVTLPAFQQLGDYAKPEKILIAQTKAEREPTTSYKLIYTLFIIFALAAIAGFATFVHMHHKKKR